MKILYAVAEAYPFAMTGGLSDVAGSLPKAVQENQTQCRVVLPLYGDVPESMRKQLTYITNFVVPVGWRNQYCGVFEGKVNGTTYYLLDNEYYFKRSGIYGHFDDGERFAFFSRAVLEMIMHIDYKPDILHANDWHTALIPIYMKTIYSDVEEYKNIKTIYTIHNINYQGQFSKEMNSDVFGLRDEDLSIVEYNGCINLMKGAIETADAVTTVSPTYALELMEAYYANGLEEIVQNNFHKFTGIINGIDTDIYNPEYDEYIFKNYSVTDIHEKVENKLALQKMFNLTVDESIPIIGMVTRLVELKGMDLLNSALEEVLSNNVQIIILGNGDKLLETYYFEMAKKYPCKMAIKTGFLPDIAKKIYAGVDMFLMPSKTEPCGLSQLIALRYGSIPIVRETGGLKDTITDCKDGCGNGFTFDTYSPQEMLNAIRRALYTYMRKDYWQVLMQRAMSCNFDWHNSAGKYIDLYKKILSS